MKLAVQAFAERDVAGREQRLEVMLDCLPEEMEFERWPRVISSGTGYQAMNDIK